MNRRFFALTAITAVIVFVGLATIFIFGFKWNTDIFFRLGCDPIENSTIEVVGGPKGRLPVTAFNCGEGWEVPQELPEEVGNFILGGNTACEPPIGSRYQDILYVLVDEMGMELAIVTFMADYSFNTPCNPGYYSRQR